jgi:hypothetical protein
MIRFADDVANRRSGVDVPARRLKFPAEISVTWHFAFASVVHRPVEQAHNRYVIGWETGLANRSHLTVRKIWFPMMVATLV